METGFNVGPGLVSGQAESGGSSTGNGRLMFGQKVYFEEAGGGSGSSSTGGLNRRVRVSGSGQSGQIPRCQVEGCGMDLTNAKSYYSKHRVCGMHSKTPKVIVAGLVQRFCQQCSRFHQLQEFDLEKRSCRRRLAGHNERRRKPQPMLTSRYGKIGPSLYGNADTVMNGTCLANQETRCTKLLSEPSWQINPINVFSGGGTSLPSTEIKLESYKGISESNCVLSLLSIPDQSHDNNNNNTWQGSSGFASMTITMAQPPPELSENQYLNQPLVFNEPVNSQICDITTDHHHQRRRQYMEHENTSVYDSSSNHTNWSL